MTNIPALVPTAVIEPSEDEIATMIAEEAQFGAAPEVRAAAARLLEVGFTVRETARRLDLRASTVWRWAQDPSLQSAIASGHTRRRAILGQRLESAAETALDALIDVVSDPDVTPRDRVKAAEAVLDRCGITPEVANAAGTAAVTVDIDFDERLARIVAAGTVSTP